MSDEIGEREVSFRNPPVSEVVLGVQFRRLGDRADRILMGFWRELGAEWSDTDFDHELTEQFETFDGVLPKLKLQFSPVQNVRIRARNGERTRMVQLQSNRLHYNWLGQNGHKYPRYEAIEPEFLSVYDKLSRFVQRTEKIDLTPNQWEITYANHIVEGQLWSNPGDWGELFPKLLGPGASPKGTKMESFRGNWQFEIPEKRGRLHVELRPLNVGNQSRLVLKLTARGPVFSENGDSDVRAGIALGHSTIVGAFRDLLSDTARKHFGDES
jgi:uncharacterized protein (TIGR04255 family)